MKKTEAAAGTAPNTDGTQAIRRAASILKAIARANSQGVSLADISKGEALPRSTAHRILRCLIEEGLVEHNAGSRRYLIGGLAYELGLAVSNGALEVARWRDVVESVARRTGVTSYLMRRSGVEAVCLLKVDGSSVVRVIPVEVGQRRLLGVGAGATALLAALDAAASARVIATIIPNMKHYPEINESILRETVEATRATGFAVSQGRVIDSVFGMGMAIPVAGATPSLAVSIAAHISAVNDVNIAAWKRVMKEEIEGAAARQKRQA